MRWSEVEIGQVVAHKNLPEKPIGIVGQKLRGSSLLIEPFVYKIHNPALFIDAHELCTPKVTIAMSLEIKIEKDGDGFHAYCPRLKGLHIGGDNIDEVFRSTRDGLLAFLRSIVKHYNEEHNPALLKGIDDKRED